MIVFYVMTSGLRGKGDKDVVELDETGQTGVGRSVQEWRF
jgi:hypothetical protein